MLQTNDVECQAVLGPATLRSGSALGASLLCSGTALLKGPVFVASLGGDGSARALLDRRHGVSKCVGDGGRSEIAHMSGVGRQRNDLHCRMS